MCGQTEAERAYNDMLVASVDEEVWVTRDGQEIPYAKLTNSHLANILRMMNRIESQMWGGIGPQGDAAQDAWQYELSQIQSTIEALEEERDRRKESSE